MLPQPEHVAAAGEGHEVPPLSAPAPPTPPSASSSSPPSTSQATLQTDSIPAIITTSHTSLVPSTSTSVSVSSSSSASAFDSPSIRSPAPSDPPSQQAAATFPVPPAQHPTVAPIAFPSGPSTSYDTLLPSAPGSATSSCRQSRSSSPAPAPALRTISHGAHTNKAWPPSATANVNAQGSAISTLTSSERQQITDSLRAHKRSSSLATLKSFASTSTPSLIAKPPSHRRASPAPPGDVASAEMPAPTQPPYKRSQTHTTRLSLTQSAAPPHSRASETADPAHSVTSEESEKERQRLKAAAAAKLAEEEAWEKTRGAGSAVLDLLKLPDISDNEAEQDRSGDSSSGRQSRATTPGSTSGSNSSLSVGGSANSNSQASSSASLHTRTSRKSAKSKSDKLCKAARVLPSLEDVQARRHEPVVVSSADKLLSRGISEYTLLPKILGRGKFSSVFLASKPHGPTGEPQLFAIKHTPLFPHHPLIATRLLREPTLLAELPPHPNLVNVYETIRTPGHFYLVEEYLNGYVTLEALLPMRSEQSPPHLPILPTGVANCVLDQLLSAVHAIHHPLQICHRDIKPENILVHPDTLQLKLLDFGLATHFSRSEAKLSTCCGSPAFHCPEIVTALRNPMGTVHYWGPEVDAWTCGITMLRLLTGIRYPIGASHTSVRSMAIRAQRAVATIKDPELRDRVGKLLEVNGERRMRNFEELVRQLETSTEEPQRGAKEFKSTTYIPVEPQHKMNLPLVVGPAAEAALTSPLLPSGATLTASKRSTPMNSRPASPVFGGDIADAHLSPAPSLLLSNPTYQPTQRVLSYVKYCLRCAGILYHCWPDTSSSSSLPSTPGPFEAAFQEYNQGRSGDLSATAQQEGGVPAALSPSTPFPIQAARSERDPYSHIHVFECVLEIVDPPPGSDQDEPQGLVQSIFSALSFGRRPANRRSLSMPPKPENLQSAGMPRPPGTPTDAPVSGSGSTSGKAGDVKCLTFYIVLRFPRRPSGHVNFVRPSYSRSLSVAGRSHRARSRASSTVGADLENGGLHRDASTESLTRLSKLHSANAEFATGIHPLRKAMIDSNHTTPRASRTSSPSVNYGNLKTREGSLVRHREHDCRRKGHNDSDSNNVGLTIETSPELLRIAENQAASRQNSPSPQSSAPNSRATSRARSAKPGRARGASTSHRNGGSNKVFVHVTDSRALDAVRNALSIGGTTTDYNPDIEPDCDDTGAAWASPDLRAKDMALGEESDPGFSIGGAGVKLRRPHSKRRHHSHRHASGLATAASEDEGTPVSSEGKRPWTDVPAGTMKPRSTISFGSDDQEQYTRGRSLGPASSLSNVAPGISVPNGTPRLRASSNLAFAVVQEESSPSNTEPSVSESRTMIDLHDKATSAAQAAANAKASASLTSAHIDLTEAAATVNRLTGELLQEGSHVDRQELESKVAEITSYLFDLQTQDAAKMTQELDALSFDLFKALSPLAGVVQQSSDSRTNLALKAKQVLDLLGEYASSREIYMAVDMRCGELLDTLVPRYLALTEGEIYTSASETVYLMRLVNTVLPRIRTKKPHGFSQVFVRLPQCLALSFAALPEEAQGSKEMLAKEAVEACCSTALIVVDWEDKCMGVEEREPVRKTSKEALQRFVEGVTVCLPHLSGAEVALSEEYFFAQNPRYELGSSKESSSVKRNKSLFAEISKTLASLEVDLGSVWSKALVSASRTPEEVETSETLTALSVAAFILDVHLRYSGYARDKPAEWKCIKARIALESALPMLLLALREQMKAAADPEMEPGKEGRLADASLVWMQWCLRGLQGEHLPDELGVSIAQMLTTQSVISPSAGAKLIRFKMLTEVVTRRCERGAAVNLIEQMIVGSPFAQVRAAGVSILRSALGVWLSSEESGEAGMEEVVGLMDKVFVLPNELSALTIETISEAAGKMTETLNLLYWVETQVRSGRADQLGDVQSKLAEWKATFVDPLAEKLDQMSKARGMGDSSEDWQKVELLMVAVQRVVTPLESNSNSDSTGPGPKT